MMGTSAPSSPYNLRQRNKPSTPSKIPSTPSKKPQEQETTWGRAHKIGWMTILGCMFLYAFCPIFVTYVWSTCNRFECSLTGPIDHLTKNNYSLESLYQVLPTPTKEGFYLYFGWLFFQAALYVFLPGKIGYGQMTPAGHILPYVVNGLFAWFVTHALFIGVSLYTGWFKLSIIHDNWGALLVAANVYGYFLTFFSYIKAHLFPSHAEDRKFSSSKVYDMFMGIEFNPRIGKLFDFKLFHNGRPGIVAWTLINFSFAAAQFLEIGYVTNSMLLLNWLHFMYVIDFFYNEDWYLRTIDIAHDHFGFYLAWGDTVWLPYMYTIQSHFLVRHPLDLSWPYFAFVAVLGSIGYYIFRAVNNQKDLVRTTGGNCQIWGQPARFIKTEYLTSNGKLHKSLLLTSGFWGLSRHFNYVGDLMISLAMCMTCGFGYIIPYFYIFYMSFLLLQRIERDHQRCHGKYGKYWEQYCEVVPYKLIPFVY